MDENTVNELALPDLFSVAARASINERCAPAFQHDVRGTMQALFSAFELLGRSAKMGGANPLRVEMACDLARRAITQHEKSTLDVLQLLTMQRHAAINVDLGALVSEVAHFLRNDAATKSVTLAVSTSPELNVCVERAQLQSLLVGLMTAAIDATPHGAELPVSTRRDGGDVLISIGCRTAFCAARNVNTLLEQPLGPLQPGELTLLFAKQFLAGNGGRLEIDCAESVPGSIRVYYPAA